MTARPWRLTRSAEAGLVEIARWTHDTFGPRQAAAYEDDLIAACQAIAAGRARTHDCRLLVAADLPEDLRFTRCGQHFVVFIDAPEQVIIVDFLHGRSDLPQRLVSLKPVQP
ncbi:type II toxin-antitoxin system RelE/ParE family toxin [Xanthobacteraceae bacterium A53D]